MAHFIRSRRAIILLGILPKGRQLIYYTVCLFWHVGANTKVLFCSFIVTLLLKKEIID